MGLPLILLVWLVDRRAARRVRDAAALRAARHRWGSSVWLAAMLLLSTLTFLIFACAEEARHTRWRGSAPPSPRTVRWLRFGDKRLHHRHGADRGRVHRRCRSMIAGDPLDREGRILALALLPDGRRLLDPRLPADPRRAAPRDQRGQPVDVGDAARPARAQAVRADEHVRAARARCRSSSTRSSGATSGASGRCSRPIGCGRRCCRSVLGIAGGRVAVRDENASHSSTPAASWRSRPPA